jgi:hypothetical protein
MANAFTQPVVISWLLLNGNVRSGCGAFVVLNSDGWIVTAAHMFEMMQIAKEHEAERLKYEDQVQAIQSNAALKPKKVREMINRLARNGEWVVKYDFFWNVAGVSVTDIYMEHGCDLAIARLQPFDASWIKQYPILKDPTSPMPVGTSLCRLGFPFHAISATYDQANNNFVLGKGVLPVPRFPNDGIHTQVVDWTHPNGSSGKFIQTSTPGLRGQSGGPIFDTAGRVWAIQCKTRSLPLDFSLTIKHNGKDVVEHQVMNVGLGAHVAELVRILDAKGISYQKMA